MGSNDSNSKLIDLALEAFMERYPNVKAKYFSTNEHSAHRASNRYYDGRLEHAQQMAGHESPRTTKLYDRTKDEITLSEVERIRL
jgi:hypothetical protein